MPDDRHLIVVGSGLVGATFISSAARLGCRITLLDKAPLVSVPDERPISLSYATVTLLKNLGLWHLLEKQASSIRQVHVSEQGRLGSLLLKASDVQHNALGYVIPYHLLEKTVCDQVKQSDFVNHIVVDDIINIEESTQVTVTFSSKQGNKTLVADRLIAADGANSRCRQLLGIKTTETSHGDIAVTALLTCQQAHDGTAYERFTRHGALALLPMWNPHHYRLVWTVDQNYFLSLSEQDILTVIKMAFQTRIGPIISYESQGNYPLKTVMAHQQVTQQTVLLGDSAHRIYPLAAQGYNLAVRDSAMLVDVLYDKKPLADYIARRGPDQQFTTKFTQGLEFIFGLQVPLFDHVRAMGLLAADLLPCVRQQLIYQILGQTGRQPSLLCVE